MSKLIEPKPALGLYFNAPSMFQIGQTSYQPDWAMSALPLIPEVRDDTSAGSPVQRAGDDGDDPFWNSGALVDQGLRDCNDRYRARSRALTFSIKAAL